MKRLLFPILLLMFAVGCTQEVEFPEPSSGENEGIIELQTRSLTGAVYNEATGVWMVPQKDPYTLANFQAAYETLSTGKSTQTLTRAQAGEFAAATRLEPTHYALKIYPRSEEEQWRVETMEDVQVAYIPFDYAQLTPEEVETLPQQVRTRSAANAFTEKSPYTVTYENYEVTDGGPTGPVTFQLPILYTVWPVEKPLPSDLEYVVDYEVFLPRASAKAQSAEALSALEREAVAAAAGIVIGPGLIPTDPMILHPPLSGNVKVYDNQLNKYVPLEIAVRCQFGSYIWETYSYSGIWGMDLPDLPAGLMYSGDLSVTVTFTYRDKSNRWKITTEGGTSPLSVGRSITFRRVPGEYSYETAQVILTSSARQENEIHRAATYFFDGQNDFPKYTRAMKIIANNVSGNGANGSFSPSSYDINIYNNGNSNSSVIGTTLHEIGHFIHYISNPSVFPNWQKIPERALLLEAFSSYSGWYLGEKYYQSLGWVKPYVGFDITGHQGRQTWWRLGSDYYSPLFVDLTDSYNQKTITSPSLPDDGLEGVPPSVVWNIVSTSTTWVQCKSKLQSYVGIYYTASAFNNWIGDFDYWVVNNSK